MDQREQIRRAYFIEGKSIRQIAQERHHDRRSVRKALSDAGPLRYTMRGPRSRPVLGPFLALVDHWLEEDQQRPPKQRHTARRIHARLTSEFGFKGGESTVRQYVRERQPRRREVMIPLEHDPGEAQADWGEAHVYLDGRLTKVQMFCLRLCYSQRPFVMAFLRQSQEAFFGGHVAAFEELGGVPRMITYDNLTLAVKRVLTGPRREEQQGFVAFRSHYLFESNFCRPREAHEKGLVENLVGYARRNFLVPLPRVTSLEELNALLRGTLPGRPGPPAPEPRPEGSRSLGRGASSSSASAASSLALLRHPAGQGHPFLPGLLRQQPLLGARRLRRPQRPGPGLHRPGGDRLRRQDRGLYLRFYGQATIHEEGPTREQIMARVVAPELEYDPERKGFAVVIEVDAVSEPFGKGTLRRDS